ncbi:hypothetical protein [Abyssisolibacter fermentans]|uniref:hypothetical protein n=1 Tax=Abyssisolibacter fermentans TaxID=1766203 RepID=UPI0008346C30|nr:hypothetical protein [Abyssisolibacter fermentans]
MNDYLKLLNNKKISLIVSLPKNDIEFAKAAIEGGVDAVKVHINVEHHASKTLFKSLKEEIKTLEQIINICKENNKPLGIVAGGNDKIPMKEIDAIIKLGFDFISLYDKHMNPLLLEREGIYKMAAINNEYDIEWVKAYDSLPIDVLECSIMDPDTYGDPLTVREILKYQSVRNATKKPIVIPTQRAIEPKQVAILDSMNINAIMIGAVVTGKESETIYEKTKEFRKAIDEISR